MPEPTLGEFTPLGTLDFLRDVADPPFPLYVFLILSRGLHRIERRRRDVSTTISYLYCGEQVALGFRLRIRHWILQVSVYAY